MERSTIAYILMGGEGKRLSPLTLTRPKPSVMNRVDRAIGDDAVENCLCSANIKDIICITQYQPAPLTRYLTSQNSLLTAMRSNAETITHLEDIMRSELSKDAELNKELDLVNAIRQSRIHIMNPGDGKEYHGTADAIYQPHQKFMQEGNTPSRTIMVFGGDHAYRVDAAQFEDYHLQKNANLTIMATPKRVDEARKKFGILIVDENSKVIGFEEKPWAPTEIPGRPGWCLASMGNYAFDRTIEEVLEQDHQKKRSSDRAQIKSEPNKYTSNDFGFDIIPNMINDGYVVFAYDFEKNIVPGATKEELGYWKDIGTIDDYYDANMELTDDNPKFNIHNTKWSAKLPKQHYPPSELKGTSFFNALIGEGVRARNAHIYRALISPGVQIGDGADVTESIIFSDCHIGSKVRIKRAILDKDLYVPNGEQIGINHRQDADRGFRVTESGIVVVPKGYQFI